MVLIQGKAIGNWNRPGHRLIYWLNITFNNNSPQITDHHPILLTGIPRSSPKLPPIPDDNVPPRQIRLRRSPEHLIPLSSVFPGLRPEQRGVEIERFVDNNAL